VKVIFFSGDNQAVSILERLTGEFRIAAVVTNPDRPKGRGLKLEPSPLKVFAQKRGIKVFDPKDPNSFEVSDQIRRENIDCAVLVSYRHFIKPLLLHLFPKGFINLHPSLLPKYRGAAPIQRALLAGETLTGVTTFFMTEEIDAGPIILQKETAISENETYGELKERLFLFGAELLSETLRLLTRGEVKPIPQNPEFATYAPAIKKDERAVNWQEKKVVVHNKIRAFSPRPTAYTFFRGKKVLLLKSELTSYPPRTPGEIVEQDGELLVSAKDGLLKIKELKIAGKKAISGRDFLNGYKPKPKEKFTID